MRRTRSEVIFLGYRHSRASDHDGNRLALGRPNGSWNIGEVSSQKSLAFGHYSGTKHATISVTGGHYRSTKTSYINLALDENETG
jgi:hypothetical protein